MFSDYLFFRILVPAFFFSLALIRKLSAVQGLFAVITVAYSHFPWDCAVGIYYRLLCLTKADVFYIKCIVCWWHLF